MNVKHLSAVSHKASLLLVLLSLLVVLIFLTPNTLGSAPVSLKVSTESSHIRTFNDVKWTTCNDCSPLTTVIEAATTTITTTLRGGSKTIHGTPSNNNKTLMDSTLSSTATMNEFNPNNIMTKNTNETKDGPIRIVFSDIDGTLVHYPKEPERFVERHDGRGMIQLPPSATGTKGILSSKTLALCRAIRQAPKSQTSSQLSVASTPEEAIPTTKLVLVSGMRASTLIQRLPYLPRADAYCCEAGGRIFYSTPVTTEIKNNRESGDDTQHDILVIQPVPFRNDDNSTEHTLHGQSNIDEMECFTLTEDMEWRRRMECIDAAGPDGYVGQEVIVRSHNPKLNGENYEDNYNEELPIDIRKRSGALWGYAKKLQEEGYVLDSKGYSTCFRINRKHQQKDDRQDINTSWMDRKDHTNRFDWLLDQLISPTVVPHNGGESKKQSSISDAVSVLTSSPVTLLPPFGITTSTNLGCIDFYPTVSGKRNCCLYLAKKFLSDDRSIAHHTTDGLNTRESDNDTYGAQLLSQHCLCICDDDNDVEMALACRHAYVPTVTSTSMERTIQSYPDHFTITTSKTPIATTKITTTQTAPFSSAASISKTYDDENYDPTVGTEKALQLILERIQSSKYL